MARKTRKIETDLDVQEAVAQMDEEAKRDSNDDPGYDPAALLDGKRDPRATPSDEELLVAERVELDGGSIYDVNADEPFEVHSARGYIRRQREGYESGGNARIYKSVVRTLLAGKGSEVGGVEGLLEQGLRGLRKEELAELVRENRRSG